MRIDVKRSSTPVAVAVNGAIIEGADIAREVQNHAGSSPKQAWQDATRALVVRQLLLQRADALHLTATPRTENGLRETEEEALIRALLEAEVRTPIASEAECRQYYQINAARFRGADLFEPLHILFQAPREDGAAYALAVERAERTVTDLQADPSQFEALARHLSDCPSADEGGRLGQVARGETTPEFETVLVAMAPGQIHPEPVRTRYGVHVIRLDRKVAGEIVPFEQVSERIAHYLDEGAWRRAVTRYVAWLAGEARVEGFDMRVAARRSAGLDTPA